MSENINENKLPFRVTKGPEKKLKAKNPENGRVYFSTDTKKILLGEDGKFLTMGNNLDIFYGKKDIPVDNSGNEQDPIVFFNIFTDLDNEAQTDIMPEINDLILNVDGCFYKITDFEDDETLKTTRLTLQGTGSGGGGGGSGPGGGGSWAINLPRKGANIVFGSASTEIPISIKCNYSGTEDNEISSIALHFKEETEPFYISNETRAFNQEYTIDIFNYKHLFEEGRKTDVTVYIYDMYGIVRSQNFSIEKVSLELNKIRNNIITNYSDKYTYSCQLVGATGSGITSKQIDYFVYSEDNLNKPILEETKELAITDEDEIQHILDFSAIPHGTYVLKVTSTAKAAGGVTLISNTLIHKIINFKEEINTPLLTIYIPENTEQYTNIPMEYLLTSSETNKEYTMNIVTNGITQAQLSTQTNKAEEFNLYFETKGTQLLTVAVPGLNLEFKTTLEIKPYTGNLPVIDSARNDLMLYLNPKNKSNNAVDRNEWTDYNGNYKGNLTGLHYGTIDGWLMDKSGASYLKLSSGATFEMPDFRPFIKDPTILDSNDSRMGSGMTIELDFEINGVLDYDTELIKCLSRNKDGDIRVGFCVTGDKIRFYSSRGVSLLSLSLIEGQRTRVSFVIEPNISNDTIDYPMIYGYLNGKLSGAVIYDSSADKFKDANDGPAILTMDSKDAQLKIYGIRVYTSALSDRVILNNYTASLATLEQRQNSYDSNNVYNAKGKIDYVKVSAEDYNLQIPYMLLTGGYATEKESKWQRKDSSDTEARLPVGKKDYRMVDVEVKYPKTSKFEDYEDYKFINKFSSGKPMATAYGEKPSNGGAIMYAQGTSSMEYPVKNLRLRFKKEDDWYTVRPDISPVEIICMKADYMESSGSHNTGSANLIDALYEGAGMKTPGQINLGGEGKPTIVTCIKGHPCLIFYSPTGEPGSYEYIGKYNLNLDKATPKPFGFDHSDSFGWLHQGDKYYEVLYGDKTEDYKEPFAGQLEPDEGADYVPNQTETEKEVAAGEKVNAIHCFEFLDNAVEVCNFLNKYKDSVDENGNKETYTYEETWYNTFTNKDGDKVPGWALGFESRYPEDRIGYHDADMLYPLASWLNELNTLKNRDEAGKKEAIARFANEYQCYLNKNFTLTYYLYTEALLMADSRVKNMMIATWGRENYELDSDRYSYYPLKETSPGIWEPDTTQEKIMTNNYIFYPIFYDMDTMLGLDNTGVYRFNYYDEDTNSSIYNGNEVLWNFVRDALSEELRPWYTELETAALTADKVLPYFNNNQADLANEAFYNGDAKYKYIDPARNGYHDDLYDKDIAPGDGPYLYAAQGDRSLMREWFLTNRFKFLQGKYASGQFKGGDRIEYRWYYPTGIEDEFVNGIDGLDHSTSINAVPPNETFTFKSLKTGYAGIQVGANASAVRTVRFEGEDTKTITALEGSGAGGTEAYILGLSNLTDLGDLSNKYMQKFIISSSDVRLKNLTLGNPHKDYYNPYWKVTAEGIPAKITLSGATYLETFNLQNCLTYNNSLDFSTCPVIKQILLTGSGVSAVTLPKNGILTELRLPTSVTALSIDSHPTLTNENFSLGTYNYDLTLDYEEQQIGKGNGSYVNDFSKLTRLEVINTPIDTYEIVTKAGNLEEYCLRNVDWKIFTDDTQYCVRFKNNNLTAEQIRSYYIYDSSTKTYNLWGKDTYPTENGVYLFERFDMLDKDNNLICIPALEYLKEKSLINSVNTAEALTGTITIDIPGAKVSEYDIYNKYRGIYPDLKIKYGNNVIVKDAYKIDFYNLPKSEIGSEVAPFYSVLSNGEQDLGWLTSPEGPTGTALKNPIKPSTNQQNFIFDNYYVDENDNKYLVSDFSNITPKTNLKLYPSYTPETRMYSITLYDAEEKIHLQGNLPWEASLYDLEKNNPNILVDYVYKENSNESYRYDFIGWQNEKDHLSGSTTPSYNIETFKVTGEVIAYPLFKETLKTIPTDLKYFNIRNKAITIADRYKNILEGSITIPKQDSQGNLLLTLNSNFGNTKLKEILFEKDSIYTEVNSYAFSAGQDIYNTTLQTVELPDTIQTIGSYAFANCLALLNVNLSDNITIIKDHAFYSKSYDPSLQVNINKLPASLTQIGTAAFQNAGANITISELPPSLVEIGSFAFYKCYNVAISHFGTEEGIGLQKIGGGAFNDCGNGVTEIHLHSSINSIDTSDNYFGCFGQFSGGLEYGKATLTYVYYYKDLNLYNNTFENDASNFLAKLGLGTLKGLTYQDARKELNK